MNRSKALRIARVTAVVAAALAGSAVHAADSATLNVTTTVPGVCKLTNVPAMTFTLDPVAGGNATSSSTVSYKCTKNTAPTGVTVGGQAQNVGYTGTLTGTTAPAETIAYSISWTNPSGGGNGLGTGVTASTFTLNGTILEANYLNVKADTYNGSVTVAINP